MSSELVRIFRQIPPWFYSVPTFISIVAAMYFTGFYFRHPDYWTPVVWQGCLRNIAWISSLISSVCFYNAWQVLATASPVSQRKELSWQQFGFALLSGLPAYLTLVYMSQCWADHVAFAPPYCPACLH